MSAGRNRNWRFKFDGYAASLGLSHGRANVSHKLGAYRCLCPTILSRSQTLAVGLQSSHHLPRHDECVLPSRLHSLVDLLAETGDAEILWKKRDLNLLGMPASRLLHPIKKLQILLHRLTILTVRDAGVDDFLVRS